MTGRIVLDKRASWAIAVDAKLKQTTNTHMPRAFSVVVMCTSLELKLRYLLPVICECLDPSKLQQQAQCW